MTDQKPNVPQAFADLLPFATTETQRAVVTLLSDGHSQRAVGNLLGMARPTVAYHLAAARRAACADLGVSTIPGMQPVKVSTDAKGRVTGVRHETAPPVADPMPDKAIIKRVSQLTGPGGEERLRWTIRSVPQEQLAQQVEARLDKCAERVEGIARPVPLSAQPTEGDLVNVYPLGDPHIGMLSWGGETGTDEDLHSLTDTLWSAVDSAIARSPRAYTGLIAPLGDYFHFDSHKPATPKSGHLLDADSRFPKMLDFGLELMLRMVSRALEAHTKVVVVVVPGNHDPAMARVMQRWLAAWYRNEPRVSVLSNDNPFIYYQHGKCLIGFNHGDGPKPEKLGGVMAADCPQAWGATEYRHWMTGHRHNDRLLELPGCKVETFRTMAASDYYAHHAGYRSGRSLQSITFHREWGEQGRSVVNLRQVQGSK